jgi:hypothetical protein
MVPLKPPINFKFKLFFSLVLVNPSSNSRSIVAETSILLLHSLELQDGSSKSLYMTNVFSLSTIGAKKPISLDFDHIVP